MSEKLIVVEDYECKFCEYTFTTKYALATHQKTAKYCLKLRSTEASVKHQCEGCKKTFTTIYDLNIHRKKCQASSVICEYQKQVDELLQYKEKYTDLVEQLADIKHEYEHKIEVLQDKLQEVAIKASQKTTTTTTNNVTNYNRTQINTLIEKLDNITQEHVISQADNLTIEHLKDGARGYTEYAMKFPFKDRVLCVDYSRRKIQFKNEIGEVITDPDTNILAQMLFESIEPKNTQLAIEYGNSLPDDMDDERRMRIIADMAGKIASVREGANGGKNDLVYDVIRRICSKSVMKGAV